MPSEFDMFLENYSDEVSSLSRDLSEFVLQTAPDSAETLHLGWKVLSYGNTNKFCPIAPHNKWVNLQFHSGTSLQDSTGRLLGSGKSMRHVKVACKQDINDDLRVLVEKASTLAR